MNLNFILKKPILTEKSLKEASLSRFTFIVEKNATKFQIQQAVAQAYGVDVIKIRTTTVSSKSHRVGKKRLVKYSAPTKKAIVELKKGQKIDIFEIHSDTK